MTAEESKKIMFDIAFTAKRYLDEGNNDRAIAKIVELIAHMIMTAKTFLIEID